MIRAQNLRGRLLLAAPPIAWMGIIFYVSHQSALPTLATHWIDAAIKNGGHFAAYFVLGALVYRAIGPSRASATGLLTAIFICVLYAGFDEVHQTFVPGRYGTLGDVIIDTSGALAGIWTVSRARFQISKLRLPAISAFWR
jgi:VanZ family protein